MSADRPKSFEDTAAYRDRVLIEEAIRAPVARAYLGQAFEYQPSGPFCGPTSVRNVLNSMEHGVNRLVATREIDARGSTLDEEASLLERQSNAPVVLRRDLDFATFKTILQGANDPRQRLIINFHRAPMFARGAGHFSPILAYLSAQDLVLVGDVNPSYGIYLVESRRLFEAMDTVDPATGQKRGIVAVSSI